MKTTILLVALFIGNLAFGQITTSTIRASFGLEAELRANYINNAAAPGTDDWFGDGAAGAGRFVIDTTGAAAWISLYNSNVSARRRSFVRKMSTPVYSVNNGTLWYDAIFVRDHHDVDSTAFVLSNKNGQSPALWVGGVQPVPMKNEIKDVMVHVRREGTRMSDSMYFIAGLSLDGLSGNRYFDIELYQTDMVYAPASGTFQNLGAEGGHTAWQFDAAGNITRAGDIIFSAEFSSSSLTLLESRIWINRSLLTTMSNPLYFDWGGAFDGDGTGAQYGYASIIPNGGGTFYSGRQSDANTWAGPYGLVDVNAGVSPVYSQGQFMEIAVNLTKLGLDPYTLTSLSNACGIPFKRLFAKTRSATSFTAELKDFIGPYKFGQPDKITTFADLTYFCGNTYQVSNLWVTNPIASSTYVWSTPNGHIITNPATGPRVTVDAAGTYIVAQTLYNGCEPYSFDTINIVRLPPCVVLEKEGASLSGVQSGEFANLSYGIAPGQFSSAVLERNTGSGFEPIAVINQNELQGGFGKYQDRITAFAGKTISYRLKLTTTQNEVRYSNVISLSGKIRVSETMLYPNPVMNNLEIILAGQTASASVYITDAAGKKLKTQQIRSQATISTAALPAGVYFLTIDYGSGMQETKKFFKK
jgi:hypothetical protein